MEESGFTVRVRYETPGLRFSRLSRVGTELVASSTEGYGGLGSGTWFDPGLGPDNGAEGYGDALGSGTWFDPGLGPGNGAEGFGGVLGSGSWLETDGFTGGTEGAGGGRSEGLGVLDEGSWEW